MLILEGNQAGLSWSTVLNKRENFRKALDGFNAEKIARYDDKKRAELLNNAGIIRNKLKVNAAIVNAQTYLKIKETGTSFSDYLWKFNEGRVTINNFKTMDDIPATTKVSDIMSKQMKKDGFKFVGSTIMYAHMQATGMVNDHIVSCFRYKPCKELAV
jgi:DNA-3-methyladenine glycosylase I